MTFTADSPVATRVLAAGASEQGPRPNGTSDIRAVCIHMAEGGGTASWLSHDDGNSSHYVVEYSGSVVQMVRESWWAGSLNPSLLRSDDDQPYKHLAEAVTYGRKAVVDAIGQVAANDPNRYVIAIEVEGFARKAPVAGKKGFDPRADPAGGPNDLQRAALATLVADIRKRHANAYPCLGHRDFQHYKPCPGKRIPWADYGGHGAKASGGPVVVGGPVPPPDPGHPHLPPPLPEAPMESFAIPAVPTMAKVKTDGWLHVSSSLGPSPANIQVSPGREMPLIGLIGATARIVDYVDSTGMPTHKAYWVKTADIESTHPAP